MIVPVANDMKVALPVTYMPAIAMITVTPETSTARPDVDAAACRDACLGVPRRSLLAFSPQVEERVVDADGEPDQQDHRRDALVDGHDLAEDPHQAERRRNGRDRQEQRDARRRKGAEGQDEDHKRDRQ